jgi:hypothetical protein
MVRKILLSLPLVLLAASPGIAETSAMRSVVMPNGGAGGDVRVQVHLNFFVAGPAENTDAALKAQEQARRKVYESAARECEVLRGAIASGCRLESISVNMSYNYGNRRGEGFNVSGNFGLRITLK